MSSDHDVMLLENHGALTVDDITAYYHYGELELVAKANFPWSYAFVN